MRTSVNLPDGAVGTVRDRAAAAGITRAEWLRRAILAACTPCEHPGPRPDGTGAPPDPCADAGNRARMEAALETVEETVTALTAERDALAARVTELENLNRVGAAEVAAAIAERDREHLEHDRLETDRDRARAKAAAVAADRDRLAERICKLEERARSAETRAAVAEAVAAERLARIEDLRMTAGTTARVSRPE